ncbi:MAG TPA: hypothetical protein GXX22_02420 [Clostridiales bacterium]|mgnify:CR=1 FL=1|nr:hypothetical protein [Clostridiales bacterium]
MTRNEEIKELLLNWRREKRRKIALAAAISIVATLVVSTLAIASLMIALGQGTGDSVEVTDTSQVGTEMLPEESGTSYGSEDEGGPAAEPQAGTSGEGEVPVLTDYDYTKPVPESPPVDKSYYDDALFIGDSRIEGFKLFSGLNNATYYSSKGLMASTAFTEHIIQPDGFDVPDGAQVGKDGKLTVAQAIEYGPSFGKVYIMFGINELGWANTKAFIGYYRQLIALIRKHNPGAIIYVQLIIPVSKSKSDSDEIYNNERIAVFNQLIAEMCAEEKVFFINTPEAVCDERGALPEDAGVDGVHMKKSYCERWRDYLLTHTVSA